MSVIDRSASIHSLGMKLRQVGRMQIGRILGSVPTTSGAYKALIDLLEAVAYLREQRVRLDDLPGLNPPWDD